MAHDLETQNGVASFASFREPAWHGLGTVFTEEKTFSFPFNFLLLLTQQHLNFKNKF